MIKLARLLLPTDFGPHSERALRYAIALAEKFEAELILLHVVPEPTLFIPEAVTLAPPVAPPDNALGEAEATLAKVVREHHLERFPVETVVREGNAVEEILKLARERAVDLIVMGTHGRTGLAHLFLDSVTEKVVRGAPCPVFTVRQAATQGSPE
jgi:nucleotide-binding universal stress UspA family protein